MPKVELTTKLQGGKIVQKGPATDYSMLLEMKRRQLIVSDSRNHGPAGRKATGVVVDGPQQRGTADGPAVPALKVKGAVLGFFKF
jgi:hypothetical protein